MSISALAIRRPVATAMFFLAVSLLGLASLDRLRVELLPEVVYPEIFVQLTQRTLSPEQAERELLIPAEGEVGVLQGVVALESNASQGRATVRVSFAPATDMKFALLQVQSRMDRLQPQLPEQTQISVLRFDTSILTAVVMELQVLGEGDLNWLREFTEQNVRPQLEAVEGVVSATVLGGQRRAVLVILNRDALEAYGLTATRVNTAITAANRPRAYLGEVHRGSSAYPVSIQGQFTTLSQVRAVMIDRTIPLRLDDIAEVRYGEQQRTDLSRVNGLSAVSIRIMKEDEANLLEVSEAVVAAVERLNSELAGAGTQLLVGANQADLMEVALGTLTQAAVIGLLLSLVVLFVFLRSLRFVSVLVVAIPVSLLVTFNLMYAGDLSLNVLSLCGLALAMGMLADNGIVVLESIFKHYERGKKPAEAARDGTAEVRRAVIASTATTVAVFLPVVFIQSDFQDILSDLAMPIGFPLAASLFVALTLVPMLGSRTLSRGAPPPRRPGRLLQMYTVLLKTALRHRVQVTLTIGVALVVTLIAAFFLLLQQQSVPAESQFPVYVELPEGATLDATDAVVRRVEEAVGDLAGVAGFTSSVQEGQGSITVSVLDRNERPGGLGVSAMQDRLAEGFDQFAEADAVVGFDPPASAAGPAGGGRPAGGGGGGFSLDLGSTGETAVIRGQDFATMQMIAEDLAFRLEEVEDIDPDSIQIDVERSGPEVQIVPDAMAMFDRDVEIQTLLDAVSESDVEGFTTATAFLEADGTETVIEVRPFDLDGGEVGGPGSSANRGLRLADLSQLPVLNSAGSATAMGELARLRIDEGRRSILRTNQARRVIVSYAFLEEVTGSQPRLDSARQLTRSVIQGLALPTGYTIEVIEAVVDTVYYWMMGVAAILVYMILAALFESFSSPIVVFATLPPAAIGAILALLLSGTGLTSQAAPMAMLGLVVLIGIAVNNGIILIDAISRLRTRGFGRERAVVAAGRSRVRPVLMTSATTLLGVLPLALERGVDYEVWPPFAITILGGLAVSTVSTLIFIPVAYLGIDQVKEWLRGIGWLGIGTATLATAALVYVFDARYESVFWTSLLVLPLWFACLTLVWLTLRVRGMRVAADLRNEPILSIRLRTLTKLYGAPGRFRREWGRFERGMELRRAAGLEPVAAAEIRQGLVFKSLFLGLVVFLHSYLEDPVWVYLLSLLTWGLVLNMAGAVGALVPPGAVRLRALGRVVVAGVVFAYIHSRVGLTSVTIATAVIWLAVGAVRWLAARVRSGKVNPDKIEGGPRPLRWLRRRSYAAAGRVPIIGVRRPPFAALAGVSLEIGRGMFGLLGPNGAGKTTLMRIVCQVLEPTHGSVLLNGKRVADFGSLHGVIGYLPQRFGLYDHMTACEYLEYRALLEGFRGDEERRERVQWCLEQVHLADRQEDVIGSFSGGMRQRVGIAQTLLHTPQVVVVDEPTAGLDPVERIRFRNLLASLSKERIVIFSTHIVEDVAGSCNRLAVLDRGKILYIGSPEEMRERAAGVVWEAIVDEERLDALSGDTNAKVVTQLRTPDGIRARFLSARATQVEGVEAQHVEPTLEDAYIYLLESERSPA